MFSVTTPIDAPELRNRFTWLFATEVEAVEVQQDLEYCRGYVCWVERP